MSDVYHGREPRAQALLPSAVPAGSMGPVNLFRRPETLDERCIGVQAGNPDVDASDAAARVAQEYEALRSAGIFSGAAPVARH